KIGKNEPVCIADEVPFDIPESWEWVRLGSVIELQSGQDMTPDKYNSNGQGIPYITGASNIENGKLLINRWTDYGRAFAYSGDILLTCKGTVGAMIILQESKVHIARQIMAVRPIGEVYVPYIKLVLETLVENLRAAAKSMIPGIAREDVFQSLFPIPPFDEQHRIVHRFLDIEPLLELYTVADTKLISLNAAFPETLKKSILQEAVQGKLVPQDPNDEPASVLLERIRAEKEQLIKEGKIKRDKHESVIFRRDNSYYEKMNGIERCIDDELPFEIPESWEWCRLKSLTENITSGSRDWAKYYSTTGAAFLRMGNLSKNSFDLRLEYIQRVSIPSKAEGTRTSLQSGDLLFSITGDVGMLGLIPDGFEEAYINQHTAMIRFLPEMRNKYIPYLLLTDYAQKFYNANQHGIKNSFRLDSIGELLVSIPPEKELFRILQRISLVLSKIAVL
ncbi:restriction endonuclease subunit S, partial [Faecalibacterium sp. AM43-5AT]|uniref:restriction endonuclease subunit S n=1 Tax=Faecalibacterium sp. AM43-5AT TaxID=2302957 RepID=UPI000EBE391E